MEQLEVTDELTDRQQAGLEAMLTEPTITAAAAKAGVGRTTLSRWVNHDYAFRLALREARSTALDIALTQIQESAGDVARRLIDIALDPNSGKRDAVTAAAKVLDLAYRNVDADEIEQRIDELERRMADAG
jgi:hypothetical protein